MLHINITVMFQAILVGLTDQSGHFLISGLQAIENWTTKTEIWVLLSSEIQVSGKKKNLQTRECLLQYKLLYVDIIMMQLHFKLMTDNK